MYKKYIIWTVLRCNRRVETGKYPKTILGSKLRMALWNIGWRAARFIDVYVTRKGWSEPDDDEIYDF